MFREPIFMHIRDRNSFELILFREPVRSQKWKSISWQFRIKETYL